MSDRTPGIIESTSVYTMAEFMRRAGMSRPTFMAARKNGLRCIELGHKRYVIGKDFLDFLDSNRESEYTLLTRPKPGLLQKET